MKCPRCAKALYPHPVASTEIDVCLSCEGVWFDEGEIRRIIAAEPNYAASALAASWSGAPIAEELSSPRELACPRCGLLMSRFFYEGKRQALVDGCSNRCGLWADDGEVRAIFEGTKTASPPPPPALWSALGRLLKRIVDRRG